MNFRSTGLPLSGVRVVDLTHVWAGPKCTQILGDLGAEIVKVESPRRADLARGLGNLLSLERYPNRQRGARRYNRSGYFNNLNRNKLGMTLDLRSPTGVAVFKRIVGVSDVVVDNFSAGVMERLGLGYESLCSAKKDIVVAAVSGFGSGGPDSANVAWADTVEALSGFFSVTGYEGGSPMPSFQGLSDSINGIAAAAAILTALHERDVTGSGQYVDLSQMEVLVALNGEALMDYAMNDRVQRPRGNLHPDLAPHGTYRCAGGDSWIAISVRDDREWTALRVAMGDPTWAADSRFDSVAGRIRCRREIDQHLQDWIRGRDHRELARTLQTAGVTCGAVLDSEEVANDPHLADRHVFQTVDHAEVGPYRYYEGMLARFPNLDLSTRKPAPLFGEDTHLVLRELLNMDDAEMRALERDQIISTQPLEEVFN